MKLNVLFKKLKYILMKVVITSYVVDLIAII